MRTFGRILNNLIVMALTMLMLGGIAGIGLYFHFSRDLPDYKQLAKYDPPIVTRLYAGDGKLLAEYATEKRIYVPLSAIPKRVINGFLAAEDKNFYRHTGIDFLGILRAAKENLGNFGHNRSLVGGSTITQQVVKNFLLTNEKSIQRKAKEAILAFRITQVYSKDRILELYLNEIYLGNGSYGIAAAALNYFNKSLDELSVEETAFLAALPKAPANYDPRRHYARAKERRDWVISRMAEDNYITADEAQRAQAMPITLRTRDETDSVRADFFAEEVRRMLATMYGSNVLYEGGLYVKTTLDPHLQEIADASLRFALMEYDRRKGFRGPVRQLSSLDNWQAALNEIPPASVPVVGTQRLAVVLKATVQEASIGFADGSKASLPLAEVKWARKAGPEGLGPEVQKISDVVTPGDVIITEPLSADEKDITQATAPYRLVQVPQVNGGLVALDPHTGRVLAMAGGYSYGGTEFNRVTQAKRQPGSAFKPFVYLTALESGFTPATIILDAPVELSQGAGLPSWKPQNYKGDYLGPATLRTGVEKSRNAMTVRLAVMLGIDRIIAVGKRLGIYNDPPRNFSLVLGASETTLMKLVNAYGMLVNGGKQITPALIERIDDRNGKTIFRRDMRECAKCTAENGATITDAVPPLPEDTRKLMIDPRVAYQMVSILQGVVERGTATRAKVVGKPLGGKTGTTNDSRDTWFVGFSPDLVCGVYVGYDNPRTLGAKETGSSVALPGFIQFMQSALKDTPSTPFRIPPGIQLVKIDHNTGMTPMPGQTQGVIYEAFVTGEDIYVPPPPGTEETASETGEKMPPAPGMAPAVAPLAQPTVTNDNGMMPGSDEPQDEYYRNPNLSPVYPGVHRAPGSPLDAPSPLPPAEDRTPVDGTGGLY